MGKIFNEKFIALVGLGYWGKNVLRNLYELGVLHTACDASQETLDSFRQKYPDANYTSSLDDVLSTPEVKAVAFATPAVTHYEMVKKTLLLGRDVYVEKPLALDLAEAEELVSIAEKEGRVLMVGHILQYHGAFLKLKSLIADGAIGDVRYVYSNRLNFGKLRAEEDVLWSFAPHDISLVLSIVGQEPVHVDSFSGGYLTEGVSDIALVSMEFEGGLRGHVFVSWLNPFKEQKLVVVGSEGMLVFDDVSQEKLFLYPHSVDMQNGVPVAVKADPEVVPFEPSEPLRAELSHFAECVIERKTPRTDGNEGLRVLSVLHRGGGE